MMCIVNCCGNCRFVVKKLRARLFVWSASKQLRSVTVLNASRLSGVLLTVGAVLESECLPMNMAKSKKVSSIPHDATKVHFAYVSIKCYFSVIF